MKKIRDKIVFILALIYLGMAFLAYVFGESMTTILFVVGGVLFVIVALYGVSLHIAERKDKRIDQLVEIAQNQDQKDDQTQILAWEETVEVEEAQEDLRLSAC